MIRISVDKAKRGKTASAGSALPALMSQGKQKEDIMIITKGYADKLISRGDAKLGPITHDDEGSRWQAVTRYDLQRVDHYRVRQ